MARKPREDVADGISHVFARGNDRRVIYRDDSDRQTYLRLLARAVTQFRWGVLAYCLMPNHVHLLIETPLANLGAGMRWLHGLYAREFNDRHGRSGHVFQGRYGSVRVKSDEQLWGVAAYIAMNPVEAAAHAGWMMAGCSSTSPGPGATRESGTARCSDRSTKPGRGRASLWRELVVATPCGASAAPSG
jgi:REP element-mobilizing transposase RayT